MEQHKSQAAEAGIPRPCKGVLAAYLARGAEFVGYSPARKSLKARGLGFS
jgi:hypothetical protein